MKNIRFKLTLTILFTFSLLFGCGQSEPNRTNQDNENIEVVGLSKNIDGIWIYEIKHKNSGCHFLVAQGSSKGLDQILKQDGLPYCTGGE